MLNVSPVNINNTNTNASMPKLKARRGYNFSYPNYRYESYNMIKPANFHAYIPSFTKIKKVQPKSSEPQPLPSIETQYKTVKAHLSSQDLTKLESLDSKGILMDKSSNDGSTVLENLYKIATQKRFPGLDSKKIMSEVITALDNPYCITQKFGDIPVNVADEISNKTGKKLPEQAYNVISSCCVVASMEFVLAHRKPAEFARFVEGLSGNNYSVNKKIKMSDFSQGTAECVWKLREFNTKSKIEKNWDDVSINIHPDKNAILRARVQASYKDPGERSSIDVLIQSALLNLGSQNSYDSLTDERTGKFNNEKTGLTDFEKDFVEDILFESSKIPVVYQNINENGHLVGYHSKPEETKQHILKSLELGHDVILGYTHLDENKNVNGGHEITVIGYGKDEKGKGYFLCNDTDDFADAPIQISEEHLLPLIHHAGIPKEALSSEDVITTPWKEILQDIKTNVLNAA